MTTPDWIVEGTEVAEYTTGNPCSVTLSTVERLTATQVVLTNGNRYQIKTLRKVGGSTWDYVTLRHPTDEAVRDLLASEALRRLYVTTSKLIRNRRTVADALAAMDAIEAAIHKARATIRKLEATNLTKET